MNFHARYPKQATAAGMIHPSRIVDQDVDAVFSPYIGFLHELREESGVAAHRGDVRILGLVSEKTSKECGFVAFMEAEMERIDDRKLPIDAFEVESFESVRFAPESISMYLKEKVGGGRHLVPLALAALAMLMTKKFGMRKMLDVFREARS